MMTDRSWLLNASRDSGSDIGDIGRAGKNGIESMLSGASNLIEKERTQWVTAGDRHGLVKLLRVLKTSCDRRKQCACVRRGRARRWWVDIMGTRARLVVSLGPQE